MDDIPAKHIYRVINENTLAYVIPEHPNGFMGVLRRSILKGASTCDDGVHSPLPGDKIRVATLEDFTAFRVQVPPDFVDDHTEPVGKLRLVRHVLGVEVYADEKGVEWTAQPDGSLVR